MRLNLILEPILVNMLPRQRSDAGVNLVESEGSTLVNVYLHQIQDLENLRFGARLDLMSECWLENKGKGVYYKTEKKNEVGGAALIIDGSF